MSSLTHCRNWAWIIGHHEGAPDHVRIEFAGGHYHQGLLIGPADFTPPDVQSGQKLSQWSSRVWYYGPSTEW